MLPFNTTSLQHYPEKTDSEFRAQEQEEVREIRFKDGEDGEDAGEDGEDGDACLHRTVLAFYPPAQFS